MYLGSLLPHPSPIKRILFCLQNSIKLVSVNITSDLHITKFNADFLVLILFHLSAALDAVIHFCHFALLSYKAPYSLNFYSTHHSSFSVCLAGSSSSISSVMVQHKYHLWSSFLSALASLVMSPCLKPSLIPYMSIPVLYLQPRPLS